MIPEFIDGKRRDRSLIKTLGTSPKADTQKWLIKIKGLYRVGPVYLSLLLQRSSMIQLTLMFSLYLSRQSFFPDYCRL